MPAQLNEDDFEALNRIDVILEGLTEAASRLDLPEPDSDLFHDDQETAVPGFASAIAHSAMSTAVCGLQGFQALWLGIEKLQRSNTFGYVHRSALLGACEAYWVLRPDDREVRVARANHAALRRLNDEIDSKTDIQSMTRLFQDDRAVTDEELTQLRDVRSECSRSVGGAPASLTRMFKEIASDLERDESLQGEDAEHFSQVLRSQWRVSSADAHGGTWQHRFSDPLAPDHDPDLLVPRRVADLGMIIAKAFTVAGIAGYACHFWEQRIAPYS